MIDVIVYPSASDDAEWMLHIRVDGREYYVPTGRGPSGHSLRDRED